jgi:sulfatase maturation enzyme AslB (radical SAM superfamily)
MTEQSRGRTVRRAARGPHVALLEDFLDAGIRTVGVMLTTDCNLRCAYCCQARGPRREMAVEVLDAAIRALVSSRLDTPRLTLLGGEPLLSPRLVRRALERVRKWAPPGMHPDVHLFTNGLRVDEKTTRFLVRQDVHIDLSFDGVASAQDDRSPGSFGVLDRLLVRLRRDHPEHFRARFAVKATLTSRNVPYLSASVRYFLSRGVRDVDVLPVVTHDPGWDTRARDELDRQLAGVVRASIEEYAHSGEIPFRAIRDGDASPRRSSAGGVVCGAARRDALFVDVDGSLSPCAAMAGSCLPQPPSLVREVMAALGGLHVADPHLAEKLKARERRAARLPLMAGELACHPRSGRCASCELRGACLICPVSIGFASAACGAHRIPAIQCDFNRLVEKHRTAFHRSIHEKTVVSGHAEPRIAARN